VSGSSQTKPLTESVASAKEALAQLTPSPSEKVTENVSKYLHRTKTGLMGTPDAPVSPHEVAEGVQLILKEPNLLGLMIPNLLHMEFEARKDSVYIFHTVMKHEDTDSQGNAYVPAVRMFESRPKLLFQIADGCNVMDLALNYGAMLRECVHHEPLAKMLLYSPTFQSFFRWVELPEFEVASDAFATFKDLLTTHPQLVATFLEETYDATFASYSKLLTSSNYVTRRLSLKLLGELLLQKENTKIMVKYVNDLENLKAVMTFLKDPSKSIQFEAFHVFKVFVANPNKQQGVVSLLGHNSDKLQRFFKDFHTDRDDAQFQEEKQIVVNMLQKMQAT